jgi:hypothetical protein
MAAAFTGSVQSGQRGRVSRESSAIGSATTKSSVPNTHHPKAE